MASLGAEFSKKLPHIFHHGLGLLPECEMASTRHLSVVNQIEIPFQCASRRIEERHFMGRGSKAGWNRKSSLGYSGIFDESAVEPSRRTDGVGNKINHHIGDDLVFRESRLRCRRMCPR